MSRQLFTAADIRRVAREHKSDLLVLGHADLVTPEAVDLATELGVRLIRQPAPERPGAPAARPAALRVVRGERVALEGLAAPGANVRLKEVITAADGAPMAAGYMAFDRGEFAWTLRYDEIDVVLEGELVVTRGEEVVRGRSGDCIFIPRGSNITFSTPSHVRFVYVKFPADQNR